MIINMSIEDSVREIIEVYSREEIEMALNELEEKYNINNTKNNKRFNCGLGLDNECDCKKDEYNVIDRPSHYCSHGIETINKIEAVIDGLPAKEAYLLASVLKYVDRAGLKDDAEQDLNKANAYAHRLVYGHWRDR